MPRRAFATLEALERRDLFATLPVLDSSAHVAVFGQPVALSATVTPGATGAVTFLDGGSVLGTAPLDAAGTAKLFATSLPVGSHAITASYGGDATHEGGTSAPLTQTVSRALTTAAVTSSAGMTVNPIRRPDRVVVVIEEDRFAGAIGDTADLPYINQLAASGLVFNNSHGVGAAAQTFGEMDYLALYSGSTHGIADDGPLYSFDSPNLANSLSDAGLSFGGYAESLPFAGDVTDVFAADPANPGFPDAYARYYNPMAMFADVGAGKTNADVNKPFSSFPSDYAALPTVSFVIPNRAHNTHGSNEVPPFAADPDTYHQLRQDADTWLRDHIDAYAQWARTHNSLLIVTTQGGNRERDFDAGGTTVVTGDPRLLVSGVNDNYINHYNVLRTVEDMYGLPPIGDVATVARLNTDGLGRLAPGGPVAQGVSAGQALSLNASVAPVAPGSGTPGGAVQFIVDGASFGSPVALTNGSASIAANTLSAGSHTITAVYAGDASYLGGTSWRVTQPISTAATAVSLSSSAPSSAAGQSVTLTATVAGPAAGSAVPTGTVTFRDGTVVLGSAPLNAAGQASLTTRALAVGTHLITATYDGDANFAGATSPALSQTITTNATSVSLTSSAATANVGQLVTLTATVATATAGAPRPTGTVTFFDGTSRLGSSALDALGKATFAISFLTAGAHPITAVYSGDASSAGSTSAVLSQQVVVAPTGPANDRFVNRTTLTGLIATATGSNVGATKEAGEPNHGGNAGGKSVWWTWTAPASGIVTIDTAGSGFRTLIGVYTGTSVGSLQRVTGLGLTVGGANTFTFVARAGQAYQLAIDGFDGTSGSIKLRITSWSALTGSKPGDVRQDKKKDKDKRKEKPNANAVRSLFTERRL